MIETRVVSWNTADELEFLKKLGTYSKLGKTVGADELRKRYAIAVRKRMRWGAIEKAAIFSALQADQVA